MCIFFNVDEIRNKKIKFLDTEIPPLVTEIPQSNLTCPSCDAGIPKRTYKQLVSKGDMVTLSKQGELKYPFFANMPLFIAFINGGEVHVSDVYGIPCMIKITLNDVVPYIEGQEI